MEKKKAEAEKTAKAQLKDKLEGDVTRLAAEKLQK